MNTSSHPPPPSSSSSSGQPSTYPSHHAHQPHHPADVDPYHHDGAAQATAAAALSQQHHDVDESNLSTPPPASANGRKRKAPSAAPGSRGVANLTPEQLQKKRANDREAQRAIRERTRNTIENLANRIKELESQQPFQELQKVVAERDAALRECEELRGRLAKVASVVGEGVEGVVGGGEGRGEGGQGAQSGGGVNLHELAALTAQQSPLPPLNNGAAAQQQQSYPVAAGAAMGYDQQQHLHPDLRSPQNASQPSPSSQTARSTTPTYPTDPALRKWSPTLDHQHPLEPFPSTNGLTYEQRLPPRAPMQQPQQSNGESMNIGFVMNSTSHHRTSSTSGAPTSAPSFPSTSPTLSTPPLYLRLPKNSLPTCPLDSLLLDFLAGRRTQLANGVPLPDVLGPAYPSLQSLKDPDTPQSHSFHPVSAFLFDILSKFPDISKVPEKVAVLYIMFLILRWQICPCEVCFERLPTWVRPMRGQLEREHAAWFDHVPWPIIRQKLIHEPHVVNFEEFFIPFTTRLSLNWPYPADQVLVTRASSTSHRRSSGGSSAGGEDDSVMMNPVFETHLRDLGNWSMGRLFATTFPFLVDESVRIRD